MTLSRTLDVTSLIDAMAQPALLVGPGRVIVAVNQAFLDDWAAYDATREDLLGACIDELVGPLDESVIRRLKRLPEGHETRWQGVTLWKAEAPASQLADIRVRPVPGSEPYELITVEPTSDIGILEKEARRVRRLSVLGTLSAGLAHDLNNQLSACMNIAHLLREDLGNDPQHDRVLTILETAAGQAAAISRRLLSIAGRGEPEICDVALGQLIERSLLLIHHELPSDDRFTVEVSQEIGSLDADPAELQYLIVLMMLATIPGLRREGSGRFVARVANADTTPSIEFEITADASTDLTEAWPEIVRIATNHGGCASDHSQGERMQLLVRMPISTTRAHLLLRPAMERPTVPPRARHRVLVIDDDPMVRDVAKAMIQRLNLDVVSADSGGHAIALIDDGLRPDVVILDLVMGSMDGARTLGRIRERIPQARVLLSSGFGNALDSRYTGGLETDGLLEKPYSMAVLRQALERVLGGPQSDP